MSIFNCNITFKMVEGDSLASTFNKLVAHNIIREDWSIISPAKTRIAIQELNEEAKEVLGVNVQMFEEDGIKLFPNVDEFDKIDKLKKIQPTQINLDNKEGIDFIFSQNPELESIGSKEEYSEYIKTIFPESKVQEVLYHGSLNKFDKFDKKAPQRDDFLGYGSGFYFTDDLKLGNYYRTYLNDEEESNEGYLYPVLLNIKNPFNTGYYSDFPSDYYYEFPKNKYDGIIGGLDEYTTKENQEYNKNNNKKEVKEIVVFEPSQIHILGNSSDIEGFKKFVGKKEIKYQTSNTQIQNLSNEAVDWIKSVLPNANIELQKDLIDGIANGSFNTVNELITLSEKYANKKTAKHEMFHLAFNRLSKQKQEEILNEGSKLFNISRGESEITTKYSLSQQNEINYVLKSVHILQSDKAKQVFEKGEKNKWDLNKILVELAISKEQRVLIKELGKTKREEILVELLNNYNYTVEVNVSKIQNLNNIDDLQLQLNNSLWVYSNDRIIDAWGEDKNQYTLENAPTEIKNYFNNYKESNTSYYSNLTVPGGTNYIEQEIATPLIIPSIKGHAQFATDNGIGWFRSDEKINVITKELTAEEKNKIIEELPFEINEKNLTISIEKDNNNLTKTRRILELQSDLFQKGRDRKDLVSENKIREFEESLQRNKENSKNLFNNQIAEINYINESLYEQGIISKQEMIESIKLESENLTLDNFKNQELELNKLKEKANNENQFLQLLNKDGNWVTFFTKAIIQDSSKKEYEKVLFPTGNTASKVEGHTTLEEFKKQKEDRIKELEKKQLKPEYFVSFVDSSGHDDYVFFDNLKEAREYYLKKNKEIEKYKNDPDFEGSYKLFNSIENNNREINQLKQELEDVEKNGFGALRPIYNFYENTVSNILKKQGFSPKLITDEYGNTWNEIDLNDVKVKEQIQTIKFQSPKLDYKGDLAIEEKIAEMMENTPDEKFPKTMLGRWIQSVRNFFRNLFKERTKIQQLLRNINQGIIPVNEYEMSPTDGLYDFTCTI